MKALTIALALLFFLWLIIGAIGRMLGADPVKKLYDSQERKERKRIKKARGEE